MAGQLPEFDPSKLQMSGEAPPKKPEKLAQIPNYSGSVAAPTSGALRERQLQGRLDLAGDRAEQEKNTETDLANAQLDGEQKSAFIINQELNDQDKLAKTRDAMQMQAYNTATNAYNSLSERYKKLGDTEIDPDRKWKSLSAGGAFNVGASMMLGGFASGIGDARQGGHNAGVDMWNRKIDQDIQSQVVNLETKRGALDQENNLVAKQYALDGDMVGYQNAKKLEGWMMVGHRLDSVARETKSASIGAQLDRAKLDIDKKVDDARNVVQDYQFGRLQNQERVAAAAAAAQAARVEATRKHVRDITEKLMVDRGMTYDDAYKIAYPIATGMKATSEEIPTATTEEELKGRYAKNPEKQKDLGERSVVVDGKDAIAVNKTAAEKWNEYNHGREVFNLALEKLKTSRANGDVGAYNAARAQLIEEYPKLLGYSRAPTEGQIKHTVGPEAIPEYNHWYTSGLAYPMVQGRTQEKIKFLDETLAVSDKAMRENTFGASAGKAPASSNKAPGVNDVPFK